MAVEINYSSTTDFTLTLNSLAHGSSRKSTSVDNSINKYTDVLVGGSLSGTSNASGWGTVEIYAYGTVDDSSEEYSDDVVGTDGAHPFGYNAPLIGAPTLTGDYYTVCGPFSVAAAFGGNIPKKWGLLVKNRTEGALAASNNSFRWIGIKYANA